MASEGWEVQRGVRVIGRVGLPKASKVRVFAALDTWWKRSSRMRRLTFSSGIRARCGGTSLALLNTIGVPTNADTLFRPQFGGTAGRQGLDGGAPAPDARPAEHGRRAAEPAPARTERTPGRRNNVDFSLPPTVTYAPNASKTRNAADVRVPPSQHLSMTILRPKAEVVAHPRLLPGD
jgi:hypothetical protein